MSPLTLLFLIGLHTPPPTSAIVAQLSQYQSLASNGSLGNEPAIPTCFTMRSYIFERQDGNAPVLVGTSTCTPAGRIRDRRVRGKGQLLVPMNLQAR
jgi:hypothetical protein